MFFVGVWLCGCPLKFGVFNDRAPSSGSRLLEGSQTCDVSVGVVPNLRALKRHHLVLLSVRSWCPIASYERAVLARLQSATAATGAAIPDVARLATLSCAACAAQQERA